MRDQVRDAIWKATDVVTHAVDEMPDLGVRWHARIWWTNKKNLVEALAHEKNQMNVQVLPHEGN